MTINATLIIQMVHFIIAYFIIDRLLLRKAVGIIDHERSTQEVLMKEIESERETVAHKEQEKESLWHQFRKRFLLDSPSIIEFPVFQDYEKTISPLSTFSKEEIKRYAPDLEQIVIKKVTNAD